MDPDDGCDVGSPYRTLALAREELDNPHKEKTWKVFGPTFRVELKLKVVYGPEEQRDLYLEMENILRNQLGDSNAAFAKPIRPSGE